MTGKNLSLIHKIHPPTVPSPGPAPLLLLLHGFGSNEDDLFSLAPHLDGRFFAVSPRAPLTLDFGGYAWWNLEWTAEGPTMKPEQEEAARPILLKFLSEVVEAYPVDPKKIVLLGFSQGAIISLSVALTAPGLVAGVAALSGRLLPHIAEGDLDRDALAKANTPILVVHGTFDSVLPITHGHYTRDTLAELPVALTYREYPMAHEVNAESLAAVARWLTGLLDS